MPSKNWLKSVPALGRAFGLPLDEAAGRGGSWKLADLNLAKSECRTNQTPLLESTPANY